MKNYFFSLIFIFSVGCLLQSPNGVFEQNSSSSGVFESSGGRLDSSDVCENNSHCRELCGSMLEKLWDQKDCYRLTEKQAQDLRDTYNQLALGQAKKLEDIEPEEMKTFLDFGEEAVLFSTAISGFEVGRAHGCVENPAKNKFCEGDGYYEQLGYAPEGARNTLEWIKESQWLKDDLKSADSNHLILKNLIYCALRDKENESCFKTTKGYESLIYNDGDFTGRIKKLSSDNAQQTLNWLTKTKIEDKPRLFYILDYDSSEDSKLFTLIHEQMIQNDLCKPENHPIQQQGSSRDGESACLFGVYCKASDYSDDYEEEMAKAGSLIDLTNFISRDLEQTTDPQEWPIGACTKLRTHWNNGNLDLGLN